MDNLLQSISNKKHVIWDWNGTLLDDVHHVVEIMNEILSEHALPLLDQKKYKSIFGFPVQMYYEKIGFDFSKTNFENLSHRFVDTYMDRLSNCKVFPHTKKLLKAVKDQNKIQSILSATDQVSLNHAIHHFELSEYFDNLFGIENKFAASKLEQGRKLLEKTQIALTDTVLIGDTDHDLEVGQKLGVDVILLAHGHQNEDRLKAAHHNVKTISL